ncbi:hypothetical protein AB0O22_09425 [Streptomyces sp. NPDC091204]|uniref:hypothetical protein n=1 Tax=Streptomyces sp. NPDC091204 TaxID=3155299 RepID=UPI0034304C21
MTSDDEYTHLSEPSPEDVQADQPPEGSDGERPLRRRIADRWNGIKPAAKMIGGVTAAAVAGGLIAYYRTRAAEDSHEDDHSRHGGDNCPPPAPDLTAIADAAKGAAELACRLIIEKYWRNQCLNPRLHASGGCTHEYRPVASHTKGPADKPFKDCQTEDS